MIPPKCPNYFLYQYERILSKPGTILKQTSFLILADEQPVLPLMSREERRWKMKEGWKAAGRKVFYGTGILYIVIFNTFGLRYLDVAVFQGLWREFL